MPKILFVMLVFTCLFVPHVWAGNKSFEEIMYGDFKKVESFALITVFFEGEDAEKIGLSSDNLTDFLRLRFKNNFSNIPYKENSELYSLISDSVNKLGVIRVRVWIVGTDFPVAYHLFIEAGSGFRWDIYHNEMMGYGSAKNVPDTVKEIITEFVEDFAISFYKARGAL